MWIIAAIAGVALLFASKARAAPTNAQIKDNNVPPPPSGSENRAARPSINAVKQAQVMADKIVYKERILQQREANNIASGTMSDPGSFFVPPGKTLPPSVTRAPPPVAVDSIRPIESSEPNNVIRTMPISVSVSPIESSTPSNVVRAASSPIFTAAGIIERSPTLGVRVTTIAGRTRHTV